MINVIVIGLILLACPIVARVSMVVILLARYSGWLKYDLEHGTEYRFNEGSPEKGEILSWLFRFPEWLEKILRKYELNNQTLINEP